MLSLRDLTVHHHDDSDEQVVAVDRLSLEIEPGDVLGVLRESGCGKSGRALGILGLLPPNGRVAAGSVRLHGRELVGLPERPALHAGVYGARSERGTAAAGAPRLVRSSRRSGLGFRLEFIS